MENVLYHIEMTLENHLLSKRLTRTELLNEIVNIFNLSVDEVDLSVLKKGFKELGTDDYFDLILPMSEDEVYTIYVLKTNEKDKYYITEIG